MSASSARLLAARAASQELRRCAREVVLGLADTADAVAATMERVAATWDRLAATAPTHHEEWRASAQRATAFAVRERGEAARLRGTLGLGDPLGRPASAPRCPHGGSAGGEPLRRSVVSCPAAR